MGSKQPCQTKFKLNQSLGQYLSTISGLGELEDAKAKLEGRKPEFDFSVER
jgi:hypothetical protein